jgi:hypothetical protein
MQVNTDFMNGFLGALGVLAVIFGLLKPTACHASGWLATLLGFSGNPRFSGLMKARRGTQTESRRDNAA